MRHLLVLCFLFFSCAKESDRTINPKTIQNQGGVDVGNMSSSAVSIPLTNASLTVPGNWTAITHDNILTLTNSGSSTIKASRADIIDLVSPSQTALEQYLESQYPERDYKFIEINGLKGVRAEVLASFDETKSDIYLVSELHDFIHITSDLRTDINGLADGEKIILTVRLKYEGEAVKNSVSHTIVVTKNSYSLSGDCEISFDIDPSSRKKCSGAPLNFSGSSIWLWEGRIVELGTESEIPFDSIKVEGEYLVAPQTKISIADIYSTFTPKKQSVEQNELPVKAGHIYLLRTVDWPNEDLIVKIKVEELVEHKSLKITYQKLVTVPAKVLKKNVTIINKNTLENEMPLQTGEVTLYNRSATKNFYYASFNFQYSTSGNRFITNGNWDLTFHDFCESGEPRLLSGQTNESFDDTSVGAIIPLENKNLDSVNKEDFTESEFKLSPCGITLEIGKTYGVLHRNIYYETLGAIQVIDLDKNNRWVRLKFRRISVIQNEKHQL